MINIKQLTVYHRDHILHDCLTGHAVRDDFDRDGVLLMRLQIFDQVDGVLFDCALGVHHSLRVLSGALDGVRVKVSLWGIPGAGDGCGVLRTAVETLNTFRL